MLPSLHRLPIDAHMLPAPSMVKLKSKPRESKVLSHMWKRITPEIATSICIELQVRQTVGAPLSGKDLKYKVEDLIRKADKGTESDTEDEDVVEQLSDQVAALVRKFENRRRRKSTKTSTVMEILPKEVMMHIMEQLWKGDVNSVVELLRSSKEWQTLFPSVRNLIRASNVILFHGSSIASSNGIASSFITLNKEFKIEPPIQIVNEFPLYALDHKFDNSFLWREVDASITIHMGHPENDMDRKIHGLRFSFDDVDDFDWNEDPDNSTNESLEYWRADEYDNLEDYKGLDAWVETQRKYEEDKRELEKEWKEGGDLYDEPETYQKELQNIEKRYNTMPYDQWNDLDDDYSALHFLADYDDFPDDEGGNSWSERTWGNVSNNDPGALSVCQQFENKRYDPETEYPAYVFKYLKPKKSVMAVNGGEETDGELSVLFEPKEQNGARFTVTMTIALTYIQPRYTMEHMWTTGDIDEGIRFKNLRITAIEIESS